MRKLVAKGTNLIIVLLAAVILFRVSINLAEQLPAFSSRPTHVWFALLVSTLTILLLLAARHFLDKNRARPKIFRKGDGKALAIGSLLYLVPASITLAIAMSVGWVSISVNTPRISFITSVIGVILLVFLSEALPEELIFRGYFYNRLNKIGRSVWITISVQAMLFLVFAFLIGAVNSFLDASFLLTFAVILGMIRTAYGSIWAPIGFHLGCITVQQAFGASWGIFTVENSHILQTFVLGMIPLTIIASYMVIKLNKGSN